MTLKKEQEIASVFKAGKKHYQQNYLCFIEPRTDQEIHYLVAAGKKSFKKSVTRNRAKRVLRAALEIVLQEKSIEGVNIALVATKDLTKVKSTEIAKSLVKLLK